MATRTIPEPGDYLVRCDYSGFVYPASEMVKLPNGALVHQSRQELTHVDHPQRFVRALPDPRPLTDVRPRGPTSSYCPVRYLVDGNGNLLDLWATAVNKQTLIDTYSEVGVASVGCTLQVWPG